MRPGIRLRGIDHVEQEPMLKNTPMVWALSFGIALSARIRVIMRHQLVGLLILLVTGSIYCVWLYSSQSGRSDRAGETLKQEIGAKSSNAWDWRVRGLIWIGKKEYDKAIADVNEAIRVAPRDAWAYNGVAWLQATCPD